MSVLLLEGTRSSDLHETHWKFASACVKEDMNDVFDQVDRDLHVSGHSPPGDEVASMFREERRRFRECVDSWQADFLEQLQIHTRIIQEASAHMTYGRSEVHPYDRLRQSLVEDDHLVLPSSGSSSCVEELLSEELHAAEHFTFSSSLSAATVDSLYKPSETTSVDSEQAGTGATGVTTGHSKKNIVACRLVEEAVAAFSTCLVVLNTLFIGFQVNSDLQRAKDGLPPESWLDWVDLGFVIAFTMELALRVGVHRSQLFKGDDRYWNIFEFTLTSTSILEWLALTMDLSFLRSLRALRVVRVARIFRIVRFVRDLRLMVASVLSSLSSLVWACVFLCCFLYLISIIIAVDVSEHILENENVDANLLEFYGSIMDSMISLFTAVSGGCDWWDLLEPLQTVNATFYTPFFIFYVAFTVFGVLNVLTAIFVDAAGRISEIDRDLVISNELSHVETSSKALRKVFTDAADHKLTITYAELERHLKSPDVEAYLRYLGMDVYDARILFQLLDLQEKGIVNIDEFVSGVMRLKGTAKGVDVASLMHEQKLMSMKFSAFMWFVQDSFQRMDGVPSQPQARRISSVEDYIIRERAKQRFNTAPPDGESSPRTPSTSISISLLKGAMLSTGVFTSLRRKTPKQSPRMSVKHIRSSAVSKQGEEWS